MNVIIPVRNQPNNPTLKYTIRSICLQHDVARVILVGHKPDWFTGDHIEHKDYAVDKKEQNIRDKVVAGARLLDKLEQDIKVTIPRQGADSYVSDRGMDNQVLNRGTGTQVSSKTFLFANDDHFILSPVNYVHNKGLLSECIKDRNPHGSYTKLLQNTFNKYGDVLNVDTHCPVVMNTQGVEKTVFDWPLWGIGFKTCYAEENGLQSEYYPDKKVYDISKADLSWLYFSAAAGCSNLRMLQDIFPEPCRFERDGV